MTNFQRLAWKLTKTTYMSAIRLCTSAARRIPSRHVISRVHRLFSVSSFRRATEAPHIAPEAMEAVRNSPTFQRMVNSPAALAAVQKLAEELQKSGPYLFIHLL